MNKNYKLNPKSRYLLVEDGKIYTLEELQKKFPNTKFYEEIEEPSSNKPTNKYPFDNIVERNIKANAPWNEAITREYDKISDPVFGLSRTEAYQKAMEENPNFSLTWDAAANIGEHMNVLTGGLLNRISPTLNIRLLYDLSNNPFKYGNSWWGNSGIVSDNFALNHPYWTVAINGLTDGVTSLGALKGYKYATTPKLIGVGAESEVYAKPFSPYVYKHSYIEPEEMAMKNKIPYFAKNKYIGQTPEGLHIYRLPRMIIPENPYPQFKLIIKNMTHKYNYRPFRHEFLKGPALRNNDYVLSDFKRMGEGLIGKTWYGSPRIIDFVLETADEFDDAMTGWE